MKLNRIEIERFRSIDEKITIREKTSKLITFVGANSLGKSNILRAINLFFNREVEPGIKFNPKVDLYHNSTSPGIIKFEFTFYPTEDKQITTYIEKNNKEDFDSYVVPVTLSCNQNGNLVYNFTATRGRKKTIPGLIERILEYVNCVYIPSIKDYKTIINSQMVRQIVGATFQGFARGIRGSRTIGEQKDRFKDLLTDVQTLLDESGDHVSAMLSSVVPSIEKFSFSLPYDNLEEFLGKLLFDIKEKELSKTISLESVGSGVQGFTIYSMLRLLHEIRPKNTYRNSKFIWLIEEPETFMHHDLQRKTKDKLKEYSKEGHVFVSTHSPVFIDKKDYGSCYIVTKNESSKIDQVTEKNIREVIAGNLGVDFRDFLDFKRYNILVEGETDKVLLTELNGLYEKRYPDEFLDMKNIEFLVCNSVSAISHFYNLYNVFNRYADFIALFDRDYAGVESRRKMIDNGVEKDNLILIPKSDHIDDNELEDLVDKPTWDWCIKKLDEAGLVAIKLKKDSIVGYDYDQKNRVEVKKKFCELLKLKARRNLVHFGKYETLLRGLKSRIESLGGT